MFETQMRWIYWLHRVCTEVIGVRMSANEPRGRSLLKFIFPSSLLPSSTSSESMHSTEWPTQTCQGCLHHCCGLTFPRCDVQTFNMWLEVCSLMSLEFLCSGPVTLFVSKVLTFSALLLRIHKNVIHQRWVAEGSANQGSLWRLICMGSCSNGNARPDQRIWI